MSWLEQISNIDNKRKKEKGEIIDVLKVVWIEWKKICQFLLHHLTLVCPKNSFYARVYGASRTRFVERVKKRKKNYLNGTFHVFNKFRLLFSHPHTHRYGYPCNNHQHSGENYCVSPPSHGRWKSDDYNISVFPKLYSGISLNGHLYIILLDFFEQTTTFYNWAI